LYFIAYYVARSGSPWYYHVVIAFVAFGWDGWGTWKMFQLDVESNSWIITTHTGLTLIALSLFVVQGYLGVTGQKGKHVFFAEKIFLPAWVISFASGGLFML